MNAKPLFTEDKADIVAYFCSECRIVKQTEEQADTCCVPPKPVLCDCGNEVEIHRSICSSCSDKNQIEKFNALPVVEWNGMTPLVLHNSDTYFFDLESIEEYADENNIKTSDLNLVLCEPNYASQVESDYWEDDLPQDQDFNEVVSFEVVRALAALNEAIGHNKTVLSWSEGSKRVLLN